MRSLLVPLLPAATTKMPPALRKLAMAVDMAGDDPPPPQLLLVILMPLAVAYFWASTASEVSPLPSAPRNFSAASDTFQSMPTTPRLLLPVAPMVPATWVPWPLSSKGLLSLLAKSQP